MSKSEIKAAMQSLQVHRPFRMPARAPSFTPPPIESVVETQVENQTQVVNPTLVENQTVDGKATQALNPSAVVNQTQVETETWVPKATSVENKTQVANPSGVEEATLVVNSIQEHVVTQVVEPSVVLDKTQDGIITPVENPTQVVNHRLGEERNSATLSRRATEQDSSVVLEARAVDGLEKGYTRVPNSILMKLVSGDCTRNEIKLALLIARFTISFQRKLAPLSKTVLERRSGLRGPAVLEAVSGLVSKGLVEKQQGDQHRPNLLGLVLPHDWDELTKTKRETEITQGGNSSPVENTTLVSKTSSSGITNPTGAGVGNPTNFKDNTTIEKNNSLSKLTEALQKYFFELKPAKKRESEWKAFESLQRDFSPEEISDCFEFIVQRGVGHGEESKQCHSPMAFLSKAIAEVLPEVKARRRKIEDRINRERTESESVKKRAVEEARESAEWDAKKRAFEAEFEDEQRREEVLTELLQGLPFSPNSHAGRMMGINRWWARSERNA